ncbi:MAG: sugar kinase [Leptospiraceae bacterium]|nr:MAG: sugar kinase [Leptospiraceae bacterium]
MNQTYKIGVDLGGTKTEVILLDPENNVLLRERIPTRKDTYENILNGICYLIDKCINHLKINYGEVEYNIGIGIPGIIDQKTQKVINANTTILIGNTLQKDLENRLQHKIKIDNDANCFVLAETIAGATKDYHNVFGIIMGTGCGGGLVINKQIYKGFHGIAGEWGHFSIHPEGPLCWCGNKGCIETFISGSGLENLYYNETGESLKVPDIVKKARNHLQPAKKIFEQFLDNFGRAVGGIISIFDPDAIVIGGGLSNIDELYTIGYEKVKKYAFYHDIKTPILKNQLGDSAGVFGAAWLNNTT